MQTGLYYLSKHGKTANMGDAYKEHKKTRLKAS
jgi:hypothetical protein